jgi:Na+/proline symporter/nitrogen-specific signal transduction histidine kinase
MLEGWFVLVTGFAYVSLLFGIAYYGDRRADAGRSIINNPYIYTLSIAVYATSWTFYGSVGRAASSGLDFLPIYLGPTLVFVLWWVVLLKIVRISKSNRITSIADFISSRYGKSTLLGGLVTVIAVIGIIPYISLQLKAVSNSLTVLLQFPEVTAPTGLAAAGIGLDTALLVAMAMAIFAILFGTRSIDASEHHEGLVAAIAFESIVKLIAFLAVGAFVTFGLYDGFGNLFAKAAANPELSRLLSINQSADYGQWVTLTILSMAAIVCLPRQFQVTVVENNDENHLKKAAWLFPLYLLLINVFVLPIAIGGLLHFPAGEVDADMFVLAVPLAENREWLALLAFIGGLSAATAMVIVATIALSTMLSNDLVLPVLFRISWLRLNERGDLTGLLLKVRRGSIVLILLLGYGYFYTIGESYTLVTIGLVSFAAVAQFAPAIIGGIFWKGATRAGALAGLTLGFLMWGYTLLLPSFALSGWLPIAFIDEGPFGIALLRPYAFLGLDGFDHMSHALFWTMLVNVGAFVGLSLLSRQSAIESLQASRFVDVLAVNGSGNGSTVWHGSANVADLRDLLVRFVGRKRTERTLAAYARTRGLNLEQLEDADAALVGFAERLLAGAIGSASARVMVASVVQGEAVGIDKVLEILDETSEVIEYSHQLEEKSRQLEAATTELREANTRLQELDRLRDDFVSTVSHELRTPLTSIRSFGEILFDHPDLETGQRKEFLSIIIKESERLTRLINQILDLAKLDSGSLQWEMEDVDPREAIRDALAATNSLIAKSVTRVDLQLPAGLPPVLVDRDRLIQVIVNLLSNATKFGTGPDSVVRITAEEQDRHLLVSVADNGPGIPAAAQERVFDRFQQAANGPAGKPGGTGLGLAICRQIIEHFGGRIWVDSKPGKGANFCFTVPLAVETKRVAAL